MTWLRPLLLAAMLGPVPAGAEPLTLPLAGADDPQLHGLMTRLLASDDRAAIAALHDLAATNPAALVALPVAQSWFAIADGLRDRIALRRIGGKWVADLAAAAFKPADLWQGGAISPVMRDQLDRALGLYELGETGKADALLAAWFNHMPAAAALPEGFADLPAAARLKAMILEQHVARGDRKAVPVLQYWLDQDRIEGWMVLAAFGDHYDAQAGQPIVSGLRLGPDTGARLQDGRRARKLLWHEQPPPPLPPETVAMVLHDLMPRPQFAPVRAYCQARCPGTTPTCEAAFVTIFGQPYHAITQATPLQAVLSAAEFFASPRGEQVLLGPGMVHRLGLDRLALDRLGGYRGAVADSPAWVAANSLDACLAEGVLRAQSPLPAVP